MGRVAVVVWWCGGGFIWGRASGYGVFFCFYGALTMSIDLLLVSNQCCLDVYFTQQSFSAPSSTTTTTATATPSTTSRTSTSYTGNTCKTIEVAILWFLLLYDLFAPRSQSFGPRGLKEKVLFAQCWGWKNRCLFFECLNSVEKWQQPSEITRRMRIYSKPKPQCLVAFLLSSHFVRLAL